MKLIVFAAFVAVCGAAKLDRSYLPPVSANNAGGSPGAIQTPFSSHQGVQEQENQIDASNLGNQGNQINRDNLSDQINQGSQANEINQEHLGNQVDHGNLRNQIVRGNQGLGGIPKGGFNNEFHGVVVDAAAPGTRASGPGESGLGAPRQNYGSQHSRVGEAAFKDVPSTSFRQEYHNEINFSPAQSEEQRFMQPPFSAQSVQSQRANAEQDRRADIVRQENEIGSDNYNYKFESSNGIRAEQSGVASNGNEAQGGFEYVGDDGQTYSLTYTAGEGGYKPVASYLPTPPPIPEAILKSLEQNARDEAAGIKDDGSYDAQRYNAGGDYNENNNNGQYNKGSSDRAVPISDSFVNRNRAQEQVSNNNNNEQNIQPIVNRNFGQQAQTVGYKPPSQQSNQQFVQKQPQSMIHIQRQPDIQHQASVPQNVKSNAESHRHITNINKFQPASELTDGQVDQQHEQGETNQSIHPAVFKEEAYHYMQPAEAFKIMNVQQQNNQFNRQPSHEIQQNVARPNYQAHQVSAKAEVPHPTHNGVTQATISSFPSSIPSKQYNAQQIIKEQQQEVSKPSYSHQQPQIPQLFTPQRPTVQKQSFEQRPSTQQMQVDELPSPQINGEIYQYNKPAQTLPPPDATPQSSVVEISQAVPVNKINENQYSAQPENQQKFQQSQFDRQQIQFNSQRQQQNTKLEQNQLRPQPQQQQIVLPQQQLKPQPHHTQFQQNVQRQQIREPQQVAHFQHHQAAQPQQSYNAQQQQIAQPQKQLNSQQAQPHYNVQQNSQPQQNSQFQQNVQRQHNRQPQQIAHHQQQLNGQQNLVNRPTKFNQVNAQRQQQATQPQQSYNTQQQPIVQPQQQFNIQQNDQSQRNHHQNAQLQHRAEISGQNQQFGDQFQGHQSSDPSELSSSSVAGQGEQFGGPREPPSFNEETGYQY